MNNRDIKETIACSIALCNGACLVLIKKKHQKSNLMTHANTQTEAYYVD